MPIIRHTNSADATWTRRAEHPGLEFEKQELVGKSDAQQCTVSLMKIPPHQAAFPYHYHILNEENFFILNGKGLLRTPDGEQEVLPGDYIFFPRGEDGAHKLTNISDTEPLIYIDFDTSNIPEICFYPDSEKIGVWCTDIRQLYFTRDQVGYYDGE
ncbi:hypothetical protein SDC9_164117 [bioreactor metagenome]|uniref:Cupin type-2 domain-containing protein n=1 Tax=bioreactor metagenome TaxID=1076179 RepID=A0A645FQT5_9ZZZZ|nr:cupin domain-containing protein [Christensenella sp.]